jgi:cytochrome c-type biogenesis protein CcmH/NrfF
MGGAFAATFTAFTVVNVNIGNLTWILWILPGILVGIWISRILKTYTKPKAALKTQPSLTVN